MSALSFAATGDAIVTRRFVGPDATAVRALFTGVDVAFTNLELTTPRPPLVPNAECQGSYLSAPPWVIDELAALGFNLYSLANNHAVDYTYRGLTDTMDELSARDLVFAGAGRTLGEARAPGYLDVAAGRVALIAATASFPSGAQAAPRRDDIDGRPGISPLRHETRYVLDADRLAMLREIDEALGTAAVGRRWERILPPRPDDGAYRFLRFEGDLLLFEQGEHPGVSTRCHAGDLAAISTSIAAARRQADLVVVSLHAHEGLNGDLNSAEPAEFVVEAARRFVDCGADIVVGHGPHQLRPVEIYRGKPIFYSLGNFMYEASTVQRYPAEMYDKVGLPATAVPADVHDARSHDDDGPRGFHTDTAYWETVVPVCQFGAGRLESLLLHPLVLERTPAQVSGQPRPATAAEGVAILSRLREQSLPLGTDLVVSRRGDGAIGVVTVGSQTQLALATT
jgi:hypothetical protein